jgi:hypothetical protein
LARVGKGMGRTEEIKFGCVKFDDVHKHNQGWAAISGDKPFRINSTRDLDNSVIWLHNLGYDMTYQAGMENHAGLRRNNYLSEKNFPAPSKDKVSVLDSDQSYNLCECLGAHPTDAAQQVSRMANLFGRVMALAFHFGLTSAPFGQLQQGFRDLAFSYDPVLPDEVVDAIEISTVHFISAERDSKSDWTQRMVLSLPKVEHGIQCAKVLMPSNQWRMIKPPVRQTQEAISEWIASISPYALVECAIDSVSERAHKLFNYGSGRKVRRWMSGIELILVNQFAKVTIKKAYAPTDINEIDYVQAVLAQHNEIHELSLSMGLIWQNIWLGLGAKKAPPPHIRKSGRAVNPLAPFIKSIDRNACFLKALALQEDGIVVAGYGKGKIHILHNGDDEALAAACRRAGVIPPFLKLDLGEDVNIDKPMPMFQEIYIQGDCDQLESADQQIFDAIVASPRI